MWNKLVNFVALIRGGMLMFSLRLTNKNIVCGRGVHLYPGSRFEVAENCTMKVGKMLIANRYAQIIVRGGVLLN